MAEVLLISGRDLEDDRGFYSSSARLGNGGQISSHQQIYGFDLEPDTESGSKFRDMTSDKRSRLFVGKRFPVEDGEDYIVLSSDGGSPFAGEEFKRNHLFVGKRGSPRFVGKRSVAGLLNRAKRFVQSEPVDETESEDYAWKAWMEDKEDGSDNAKRSRMFVGKRRGSGESEEGGKRSRLFVGRRGELESQRETDHTGAMCSVDGGAVEADKRSRLFVGKRPIFEHHLQSQKSSSDEDHQAIAEKDDKVDIIPSPEVSHAPELEKRPRLFPGKRPAPGFVGKRPAPGFVGKREA